MRYLFLFFFCCLSLYGRSQSGTCTAHLTLQQDSTDAINSRLFSKADLKADLDTLFDILKQNHPGLHNYMSDSLDEQLKLEAYLNLENSPADSLSSAEFYRMIVPYVAEIKCAHTFVNLPSNWYSYNKFFPLGLWFFEGKGYIYNNYSCDSTVFQASEVTAINGVPLSNITDSILPYVIADGHIQKARWHELSKSFPTYYAEYFGTPDTFHIATTKFTDSTALEYHIPGINYKRLAYSLTERYSKNNPTLLFNQLDDSTAYLLVRSFNRSHLKRSKQNFSCFVRKKFRKLRKKNIPNLIIDLRNNPGGDDFLTVRLYHYIANGDYQMFETIEAMHAQNFPYAALSDQKKRLSGVVFKKASAADGRYTLRVNSSSFVHSNWKKAYKGKVYLMTDAGTFSSASIFAAMFKRQNRGLIIGDETAGANDRMNGYIIPTFTLPNSQITLDMALTTAKSPKNTDPAGRGVLPDRLVKGTIEDVYKAKDPQLQYLHDLIHGKNPPE